MQGTLWSNNGQGYNTQDDASKSIQQLGVTPTSSTPREMM
jgi:hypothetical protein